MESQDPGFCEMIMVLKGCVKKFHLCLGEKNRKKCVICIYDIYICILKEIDAIVALYLTIWVSLSVSRPVTSFKVSMFQCFNV